MTGKKAMKRQVAPRSWPIHRKEHKWTVKPHPGAHNIKSSIPLAILLREILGVARNVREVKYILTGRKIRVDGREVTDYRFPVGLMDVIEEVPTGRTFRMLPTKGRYSYPFEIDQKEKWLKPLRIKGKQRTKGGSIQVNFHDGRSMLASREEAEHLSPGDTVMFDLKERKALEHIPLKVGSMALITGGPKRGVTGRVVDIRATTGTRERTITLATEDGKTATTISSYVFPVGTESPAISIPARGSRP